MDANSNSAVPTFKTPAPVVAKNSQHVLEANSLAASILSPSLDSTSPGEATRKKSGFVITRIDKASISSALENESDMENEFFNDRGGTGTRSPGSSSVISESSSVFDDGSSPEKPIIPRISLQGATPVISPCPTRPSAFLPPSGLKPLNAALSNLHDQETVVGGSVLSPLTATQSPAAGSSKDTSSSASSSRFHIIKIDTGPYKRGRWNCRDFDESCSSSVRSDMIAVGGPKNGSSNCSSGKASYYVVDENGKQGDGPQTPLLLLAATAAVGSAMDHHHNVQPSTQFIVESQTQRAVSPMPNDQVLDASVHHQSAPGFPNETILLLQQQQNPLAPSINGASPQQVPPSLTNRLSTPSGVQLNNAAAAILDSIIVGSMQQRGGQLLTSASSSKEEDRETSLLTASLQETGADGDNTAMVQNAEPSPAGTPSVAIDNKIEQAMDLVKTHLLYAVREEVEVLKEKIVDLEKKVFRLETENKLLREYAPPEILQQIQHQNGDGQTVSQLLNAPMMSQQAQSPSPSQPQVVAGQPAVVAPVLAPVQPSGTALVPESEIALFDGAISNAISPSQQPPPPQPPSS